MKKNIIFTLLLIFSLVSISAKKQEIPVWVLNYEEVYPESEYIAQKGTGKSADAAKSNAAANMSFYFQTNVNAKREVNYKSLETGNGEKTKIKTEQKVERNTTLDTSTSLAALEFTEPWLNKKDKTWHCVAFSERKTLWTNYEPEVRVAKDKFKNFYNKAMESNEPFEKIKLLGIAQSQGTDFLDKISYAQFLSEPLTDKAFRDDIAIFSSLASIQQSEKNNSPFFVLVRDDEGNSIYSQITKVLSDLGFTVVIDKNLAVYVADALPKFEFQSDSATGLLTYQPSVRISFSGKNGNIYVYSKNCGKLKVYSESTGKRKCIQKINQELESSFRNDFESALNGNK